MLNWHGLDYPKDRFFVKGTEIAAALCGAHSRFQIVETRSLNSDPEDLYGLVYRVRDAFTVSDSQVREGKHPQVVKTFSDVDDAIAFCVANDPPFNTDRDD